MTNYDWRVQVRVTGTRDGWSRTFVDTPTFELHSNAQFSGIWSSADTAARVARNMFLGMTQPGDEIHVTVSALDGSDHLTRTFAGLVKS